MTRDSVIINVPPKVVQGNVFWTSVPISSFDSLRLLWILWVINGEAKKLQINGIQFKRELMEHTLFHQLSPYFNGFVDYCQNNTDNFLFDLSKVAVFIQCTYLLSELITLVSDLRTECSGRLCSGQTLLITSVQNVCVCMFYTISYANAAFAAYFSDLRREKGERGGGRRDRVKWCESIRTTSNT